ncbi:hypothetical protein BB559_001925 [Furculomyces boomerangus]|uniref:HMG box domain-containing protein n=1 Tax=Furculomyces boomerangus TaxID=61424 RepID=A0A2T9YZJ1_9FUNG|nr:hypothetical protein BB559_001925 [Furculomyces boomerangus]
MTRSKQKSLIQFTSGELTEIGNHFARLSEIFLNAAKSSRESNPEQIKKAPKDPNAPKRPLSSYILFCSDYREAARLKNPTISSQDISKVLGEMWKGIDSKLKNKYEEMAKLSKIRYENELAAYKKTKENVNIEEMAETSRDYDIAHNIMSGFDDIHGSHFYNDMNSSML